MELFSQKFQIINRLWWECTVFRLCNGDATERQHWKTKNKNRNNSTSLFRSPTFRRIHRETKKKWHEKENSTKCRRFIRELVKKSGNDILHGFASFFVDFLFTRSPLSVVRFRWFFICFEAEPLNFQNLISLWFLVNALKRHSNSQMSQLDRKPPALQT